MLTTYYVVSTKDEPTICWTPATDWANMCLASDSGNLPSLEILVKSSPPPAYSITMWSFASVSTTSYRRIMLGWWSLSILEISLDKSRCVFWSNLVLSRIFIATFSANQIKCLIFYKHYSKNHISYLINTKFWQGMFMYPQNISIFI